MLAFGAVLFVAGATVFSIGLIGYFDEENPAPPQASATDLTPADLQDVDGLPVAIPYYNPERAEPEKEAPVTAPLRLVIESIGVDAPVDTYSLDANGVPQVPTAADAAEVVAWYDFSSKPGEGHNAVFAAHVNWDYAPAVFANISKLKAGDTVRLIADDGREYTYEVFANFAVDPFNADSLKVMAPTPTDTVTLITCGGTWVPDPSERFGGNYSNRTIVQAKLVDASVVVPVPSAISDS